MEINSNIFPFNIEIDDDDIVAAVQDKLDIVIGDYDRDNPLHDRMNWEDARMCGYLDSIDPEEMLELVKQALRFGGREWIRPVVREEITKWGQSFGNVLANMTSDDKDRTDGDS